MFANIIREMKKLQTTPKSTPHQRRVLRDYFNVPARGPGSRPDFLTLRTRYNQFAENYRLRVIQDRTIPGQLANIRTRIALREALRRRRALRDGNVIRPDRDEYDIHEHIKSNLRRFRGQTVRVITVVDGEIVQVVLLDVPALGFKAWWDSVWYRFMYDSDTTYLHQFSDEDSDIKIIFSPSLNVEPERLNQLFADGITNCLLSHILGWADDLLHHNETEKRKAGILRYTTLVKKVKGYINKYPKGVPEDVIQEIANDLQVGIQIDIPFNKDIFLNVVSHKKALRKFKYINTRANHVELNDIVNVDCSTEVDIDELNDVFVKKYQEDIDNGKAYYKRDRNNRITMLYTFDGVFRASNEYNETINQFEIDTGLNEVSIEHYANTDLSHFIRNGAHFNETIDYNKSINPDRHIDMFRAYTQYKKSKWYGGFLGKITDFRKLPVGTGLDFLKKWIGEYRIGVIDFSGFKFDIRHLNKLACYKDYNIYPSVELVALLECGLKFDILEGAWGTRLDFDFTPEMIDKKDNIITNGKEKSVRYFAKYIGGCFSFNETNKFFMKGSKEYFQNIQYVLNKNEVKARVSVFNDGEGIIAYPKNYISHKSHISAFILSYQRLIVLEQLFRMDYTKIRRVCVDGIYYRNHPIEIHPSFRQKDEYKLNNEAGNCYCSGVIDYYNQYQECDDECYERWVPDPGRVPYVECPNEYREPYQTELFLGAGGNGKTHFNLTDSGLVGVLFVAPSWELATAKRKEYNCDATVMYRALDDKADEANAQRYKKKYNTILVDEASMITETDREKLFELYHNCKLIFCGDIGFQLPPVSGNVMSSSNFDKITTLTKNYRFKCDKHSDIIEGVRQMIACGYSKSRINQFICDNYTQMKRSEITDYVPQEDIILCSRAKCGVEEHPVKCNCNGKNYAQEWADKFGETKFKCLERGNGFFNGTVVYEKPKGVKSEVRHGFTIHSVQGKTYENKIYLDSRRLFSVEMGYTAISRAMYWNQIIIITD